MGLEKVFSGSSSIFRNKVESNLKSLRPSHIEQGQKKKKSSFKNKNNFKFNFELMKSYSIIIIRLNSIDLPYLLTVKIVVPCYLYFFLIVHYFKEDI